MIFSAILRSIFVCTLFACVSLACAQQYTQVQAPFMLDARQQSDLDLFLKRWEEFSGKIKRFEIGFTTYNNNLGETPFSTYGSFNYIAPDKMSLHIQGEWLSKTERKDGSRQEKLIADGRAIYVYDFSKKVVKEMPLPPEMQGKTISTGPLPLVFGAKADDMKSRYWLRLVTPEAAASTQVWLEVFPRWAEDAAEFQRVILAVNKDTMVPAGMKVVDVNAKSYVDYAFDAKSCKINSRLDEIASTWRELFTEVPLGWKREIISQNVSQNAPGNNVANNSAPSPQESSNAPKTVNLYSP